MSDMRERLAKRIAAAPEHSGMGLRFNIGYVTEGERDEIVTALSAPQGGEVVHTFLDKVHEVLCRRFPRCRECADWNGTCPHSELPCDLTKAFLDVKATLAASPSAKAEE